MLNAKCAQRRVQHLMCAAVVKFAILSIPFICAMHKKVRLLAKWANFEFQRGHSLREGRKGASI
jgi:hypothetical protein